MIIVVDTNVFVRDTHLLRKKSGPALVQLLRATKGQLLIPEILHREYVEQTIKVANEARSRVEAASSILRTLLGVRIDHRVPDGESIRLGAVSRLRELEALTLSDPLTAELHLAAGTRTLENKRPTSKTDHGYKDCLIWESVLRLPQESEVRFVSRDSKAFFNKDSFDAELIEEARKRGITVVGYQDIERVVEELLKANPALDLAKLEAQDLAGQATDAVEGVHLPSPAPRPREVAGRDLSDPEDVRQVARRVSVAQESFDGVSLKVLAYIAYLDSVSKDDLFAALADADIRSDVARNVAERLVITGFVRDTGNYYLVVDRAIGEVVAPTVEVEIIDWLGKKRRQDGK